MLRPGKSDKLHSFSPKSLLRRFALVALVPLVLVQVMACRAKESVVAVIPRTCGTWLWEAEHTGVAREEPKHGLSVYWNAPMREDDVQGQIEILASAVKQKVKGVVIAPIEDLPLRTPLQRTIRAGIPVVVVGTDLGLTPNNDLTYVVNDERAGGELAARRIGRILKGRGAVAIVGINKKLASTAERARSLEAALADEFPQIRVVFRSLALPTVSQEQQVAERMLAEEQHPDAIIALSESSTRGTFFALIESDRSRKIPLVGFDQNLLAPIRIGEIDSVIVLNSYEMGRAAMQLISDELAGKTKRTEVVVEPELVTRETIDTPKVRETLDLDWFRQ